VQASYANSFVREINAGNCGTMLSHAFRQDTATTADVEDIFSFDPGKPINPFEAKRVDLVQRFEFALRIPPTMGKRAEFIDFVLVGVEHGAHDVRLSLNTSINHEVHEEHEEHEDKQ
jgi:hypothetical protein